ncbi:MAG: hypothetical protein ACKOGA_10555 [Planctomycetaceae bacterium]
MGRSKRETRVVGAVRDRVRELRRVRAGELLPHPENWRSHPTHQRVACAGLLRELGYADALLAIERGDGQLQLVDGHRRAETTPDAVVPVLILDLDEDEARRLLLTLDPLASLAEATAAARDQLLSSVRFQSAELLEEMTQAWQRVRPRLESPAAFQHPGNRADTAPGGSPSAPSESEPSGGGGRPGSGERGGRGAGRRGGPGRAGPLELTPRHCVLIDCADEAEQLQLLERLAGEGLKCRALIA